MDFGFFATERVDLGPHYVQPALVRHPFSSALVFEVHHRPGTVIAENYTQQALCASGEVLFV